MEQETIELKHPHSASTAKSETFVTTDPVTDLAELAHIMLNLRFWSKEWHRSYGTPNRIAKERWEAKADEWIEQHKKIERPKAEYDNDKQEA